MGTTVSAGIQATTSVRSARRLAAFVLRRQRRHLQGQLQGLQHLRCLRPPPRLAPTLTAPANTTRIRDIAAAVITSGQIVGRLAESAARRPALTKMVLVPITEAKGTAPLTTSRKIAHRLVAFAEGSASFSPS